MRTIPFVKMSGTGNDFMLVDNRTALIQEPELADFARAACPRGVSVGADGVVLIEPARAAGHDYRMRIINADGSEAEMCGNASRCIAVLARQLGSAGQRQTIETIAGSLSASVAPDGRSARVQLSQPGRMRLKKAVPVLGRKLDLYSIDTGVPHAVCYVKDVARVKVRRLGAAIRRHRAFRPRGTNANFVQLLGDGAIRMRTYERGVEDETLACGTGACAAAIVTGLVHGYASPTRVHVASGDVVTIHFELDRKHKTAARPFLEGAVRTVYRGEYYWQ